jgi:hypothetical protein
MNRFVMKGEHGIKILVPMTRKVENKEPGEEEKRIFFAVGTVFDVLQTSGEDLPQIHVPVLEGDEGADLYAKTWEFLTHAGVTPKDRENIASRAPRFRDARLTC